MDPIKILKRAWQILWSYRALWVFGLILALAGAGSSGGGGGNSGYQFNGNNQQQYNQNWNPEDMPQSFREAFDEMRVLFNEGAHAAGIVQQELNAMIWIAVAAVVFFIVLSIVTTVARYVAETAMLRMVDEYEASGTQMTVRQGFRIGWSRTSWRLFFIDLIVNLPFILLVAVLLIAGVIIYQMATSGNATASVVGIVSLIGVVFLSIFVAVILGISLYLLRHFFWRACALEGLGVSDSLARGFAMVCENWKSVGLMWLVMIGVGIVWWIASMILVFVTIPIVIITAILGAVVAAIPGLLLVGVFSTFLSGYLPWIAALLFVLPLFFTIAFSPWLLLGAWQSVFASSVWTLTYRELKAVPDSTPKIEPAVS
jgi:hypothetical protein